MTIWEILLIGMGLSMDAVAVTISDALVYRNLGRRRLLIPVFFGVFQGAMPVLGYLAGGMFAQWIERYAKWLILIILGFIGAKMVADALCRKEGTRPPAAFTLQLLLAQAFATSVDAFAVGVGLSAARADIAFAAVCIALTTCVLSAAVMPLARRLGHRMEHRAELLGGLILVFLAVKSLF